MSKRLLMSVVAPAAFVLAGCASSFHDSYLVGERWNRADMHTYPVSILSVDDTDYLQRRILVSPGMHTLRLQGPRVVGMEGEVREFRLEVEPCNTYYIVAVKPNALATDFTPKVDYTEPLGGCTPPPGWKKQ